MTCTCSPCCCTGGGDHCRQAGCKVCCPIEKAPVAAVHDGDEVDTADHHARDWQFLAFSQSTFKYIGISEAWPAPPSLAQLAPQRPTWREVCIWQDGYTAGLQAAKTTGDTP